MDIPKDSWSSVTLWDNIIVPVHPEKITSPLVYTRRFAGSISPQSATYVVLDFDVNKHNGGTLQWRVEFSFDGIDFFTESNDSYYGTNTPEPFTVLLAATPVSRLVQLSPLRPRIKLSAQVEMYHRLFRIVIQKLGPAFSQDGGFTLKARISGEGLLLIQ